MTLFNSIYIHSRPNIDDNEKVRVLVSAIKEEAANKTYMIPIVDESHITSLTLIVAVGGDGTFLHAAKIAHKYNATVTGFNLGRKGFLVDNDPLTLPVFMAEFATGFEEYNINKRRVLAVDDKIAINEFLVSPKSTGESLAIEVFVNGKKALETIGSGVIVATPTGSTAMALSSGGPIVSPESSSTVIVPVLAHSLASRPLIVPDHHDIQIKILRGDALLFTDGAQSSMDDDITFNTTYDNNIYLLQKKDWDFYTVLRNKMGWN